MRDEYRMCVIGMGYVGLTLASVFAKESFEVIGVDTNETIVQGLVKKKPHFFEKGLEDLLISLGEKITFSQKIIPSDKKTIYVIAVGTDVNHGKPDFSQIDSATENVAINLKRGDVIILRSTVMIGTTKARIVPALEEGSGLRAGTEFRVIFAPERTVEGKAIEELYTLPQVVGGFTKECVEFGVCFFSHITKVVIPVNTLESAEMVKLISNSYRDLTFAFANAVALIAADHNVDVNEVIKSANYGYARNSIPLPSPGVGGYCLTKDPYLLTYGYKTLHSVREMLVQGREVNAYMPTHVAQIIENYMHARGLHDAKILLYGLAFKSSPPTSDVRFSPTHELIMLLQKMGIIEIFGCDKLVHSSVYDEWGITKISETGNFEVDIIVLMHMNQDFANIIAKAVPEKRKRRLLIVDPWGQMPVEIFKIADMIDYTTLSYKSY